MNFRLRQKSLAGGQRKEGARRRSMGMLNFNSNTATTVNASTRKTILIQQLKQSKLFTSAQSEWYNAEILYYVEVGKSPSPYLSPSSLSPRRTY